MPLSDLSNPDVLLRENWQTQCRLGADGTPLLPPRFVAEAGPRVWIVDVREDGELTGPLGHIPGVWRMPLGRIAEVATALRAYTPVVLVCDDGSRSSTGARFLEALGMTTVAALDGGMAHWRTKGFGVSRDAEVRFLEAPAPGHGSDGRLLSGGTKEKHLSLDAIEAHVGDASKVRRVKLAAFLLATQTSCVDGREDRAIIGTPGGDAGELLLGLAAVEAVTGKEVSPDDVPTLARAFADTFGGIYLHTDNHALNRLVRSLRSDDRLKDAVASLQTIDDWEAFLRRPPRDLRPALLEHLQQPEHVGCGHIKLALTQPDAYRVRPALITRFFEAFYSGLWQGAPDLTWVVLGGDHAEGAVVQVTVEEALHPFSEIPMIAPSIGGVQMFVNHPQVVAYLRQQTAHFLANRVASLLGLEEGMEAKLLEEIPKIGDVQAGATLAALAAGLPVFNVHFGRDGKAAVHEEGSIPAS
ncbi:MAG TPA: rhodanese-like domain-containing protein [Sandaracinaceae bacterium LLY-WYZ-13_1]|nr:rhodanese-like domain-containing protein [Sandaracinaceae bacterium LLY-WYZ-13_1]